MVLIITDLEFYRIANYIRLNFGVNLIHKRPLVEKRLEEILGKKNYTSVNDFMNEVETDKSKNLDEILIGSLFTNHTFFMRDEIHFNLLKEVILPKFIKNSNQNESIRIWSAATSSGQEAYTIQMVAKDYLEEENIFCEIQVLGTDISDYMLKKAKMGDYTKEQMDKVPDEWKRKYFTKKINGDYKINDGMKNEIIFKEFNLLSPFSFEKKFHVIFLRNVLIYFECGIVDLIVEKVADQLMIGGYLFIGTTEMIEINSNKFLLIQPSVYRRI